MPAAPRKSAPNAKVDLDLTGLDIQPDAPVAVRISSTSIVHLNNVKDLDWQIIAGLSVDRPFQFFESVVAEADQEEFLATKLSGKHMEHLMKFYMDHFEVRPGE